MISCIICSNNATYAANIAANIAATIGVEFELIIDADAGTTGICQAYNAAAHRAKYPYLCFLHDDINFLTHYWGERAIAHFAATENTGVIGIAGSIFKPAMISGWWQPDVNGIEPKRVNLVQHFKYSTREKEHHYHNPLFEERSLVATLDGAFLFTTKKVWQAIRFDEERLRGFHAYDLDFSLHSSIAHNNFVVYNIFLEHYSEGSNDLQWFTSNLSIHTKWKNVLPLIKSPDIRPEDLDAVDQLWLHQLLSFPVASFRQRWQLIAGSLPLLGNKIWRLGILQSMVKYLYTTPQPNNERAT